MARHFNNKCRDPHDPHKYLAIQIAEPMTTKMSELLCHEEKYLQLQLFTTTYDMNILLDLYSRKRIGCRTK